MTAAFDVSCEKTRAPLHVGATLGPAPPGGALVGKDLADFLRARRIDALVCVPTRLATLDAATLPGLDVLRVSGAACPAGLVARWHRPGRTFPNVHGPTEARVTGTLARPGPGGAATIGRPLPTCTIAILDETGTRTLPQGAVGDIAVAGLGVAEGYRHLPEKTAAAVGPDVLGIATIPGRRLSLTGEPGRITADGEIARPGRKDSRVRIRRYRIALSEIESRLMRRPGVAQAVVDAWEPAPGLKDLVACCSATSAEAPRDADRLHAMRRETVPRAMLPTWVEILEALRMLPSDTGDRKRLPPPSRKPRAAPETARESAMAGALAALLGLESVSIGDDLIDALGANCLLPACYCSGLGTGDAPLRVGIRDSSATPRSGRASRRWAPTAERRRGRCAWTSRITAPATCSTG